MLIIIISDFFSSLFNLKIVKGQVSDNI